MGVRGPYEELGGEVERLARTWEDDLRDALIERVDAAGGGLQLAEKWAARFYFPAPRTADRLHWFKPPGAHLCGAAR